MSRFREPTSRNFEPIFISLSRFCDPRAQGMKTFENLADILTRCGGVQLPEPDQLWFRDPESPPSSMTRIETTSHLITAPFILTEQETQKSRGTQPIIDRTSNGDLRAIKMLVNREFSGPILIYTVLIFRANILHATVSILASWRVSSLHQLSLTGINSLEKVTWLTPVLRLHGPTNHL
jgi:hypothetical protein